ncbi:MAG: hypothetical protein AB1585_17910, partial [Thermodesulfobacteriota bacterium]
AASQEKLSENMAFFGLAFVPLALAGHISHLSHEFLSEGIYALLGYLAKVYQWLVFAVPIGSREIILPPFIHGAVVTFIKVLTILGGFFGSIVAVTMIARKLSAKNVFARIMPHLLALVFFLVCYMLIFTASTAEPVPATGGPGKTSGVSGTQVPGTATLPVR